MTIEHAKTVMDAGAKWAGGMSWSFETCHTLGQPRQFAYGRVYDSVHPLSFTGCVPDLEDGPTCDALEGQLVELIRAAFPNAIIRICRHSAKRDRWRWFIVEDDANRRPLLDTDGTRSEVLAAAWSWWKEARDGR